MINFILSNEIRILFLNDWFKDGINANMHFVAQKKSGTGLSTIIKEKGLFLSTSSTVFRLLGSNCM